MCSKKASLLVAAEKLDFLISLVSFADESQEKFLKISKKRKKYLVNSK
jgi:hypothetical protein